MKRNSNLDLLRAAAIVAVVICHLSERQLFPFLSREALLQGRLGVDLFFVLSGFLVTSILARLSRRPEGYRLRDFWVPRWARTLPTYFAALALYTFVDFDLRHTQGLARLGQLFFVQNFYRNPPGFLVSWSLCVEEHYYLLLPLLWGLLLPQFRRFNRATGARKWIAPALISAIPLLLRFAQARLGWTVGNFDQFQQTHLRWEGMWLGSWLAVQATDGCLGSLGSGDSQALRRWLVGGLVFFGVAWELSGLYSPLAAAWGGYCLIRAAIGMAPWTGSRSAVTRWLATRSYSIYLIHSGALHFLRGTPWDLLLAVAAIAFSGELFYRLVEAPALRLKDRVQGAPASYPVERYPAPL